MRSESKDAKERTLRELIDLQLLRIEQVRFHLAELDRSTGAAVSARRLLGQMLADLGELEKAQEAAAGRTKGDARVLQ